MEAKKKLRFIPFGYKLMLSYCLFIMIPIIVVASIANSIYVKSIREQTQLNLQGTLKQIADNVSYKLDDAIRVTNLLYYDSKLIRTLNHYEEGWHSYDATVNEVLPKLHDTIKSSNHPFMLSVYLHNRSLPEVYNIRVKSDPFSVTSSYYDLFHMTRIVEKEWYRSFPPEEYGNTLQWKQIEDDRRFGLISLLRRIVDVNDIRKSKEVGFIRATFNLDDLLDSIDYRKIGEGSTILIAGQDNEFIYQSGADTITMELLENKEMLTDHLLIEETLPYLNWRLVTLVHTNIIEEDVKAVRMVTFVVCIICFAVFFLIGAFLSGFFSKRVGKIVSVLRSFQEGDFHKRMNYRGNDEFSMIALALNNMGGNTEALIQEVYLSNIQKKEAELESLQAQINPHFLYNTLSSISSLAKFGEVDKINRMVIDLAKFYRLTLNEGRNVILLKDELEQAQAYINIQRTKYGNRMTVYYDLDPGVLQFETIKLILQPIIENVFEHAWIADHVHMRIVASRYEDLIIFKIIDDGVGIHPDILRQIQDPLDHLSVGYGIRNVDERIKLHFGKSYGVSIYSRLGIGTTVSITIPVSSMKQANH